MITNPKTLYRYSEKEWLDKSLFEGKFRLSPASKIKKIENDFSRQDDEQRLETIIPNEKASIVNVSAGQLIKPTSHIKRTEEILTDYYMLCLSTKKESYLFREFPGSDFCLVIHDVQEFRKRVFLHTQNNISNWYVIDKHVIYGGECELAPIFKKPNKYIFQFEWRFAWIPIEGKFANLDYKYIEIGSIEDIAEIIPKF